MWNEMLLFIYRKPSQQLNSRAAKKKKQQKIEMDAFHIIAR